MKKPVIHKLKGLGGDQWVCYTTGDLFTGIGDTFIEAYNDWVMSHGSKWAGHAIHHVIVCPLPNL